MIMSNVSVAPLENFIHVPDGKFRIRTNYTLIFISSVRDTAKGSAEPLPEI